MQNIYHDTAELPNNGFRPILALGLESIISSSRIFNAFEIFAYIMSFIDDFISVIWRPRPVPLYVYRDAIMTDTGDVDTEL